MENSEFDKAKIGDYIAYKDDRGLPRYVVMEKGDDWIKFTAKVFGIHLTFTRKEFDSAFCRLNAPVTPAPDMQVSTNNY